MGKDLNINQDLIYVALRELNTLLINDKITKYHIKTILEDDLKGKHSTQYTLDQADAHFELYRLRKVFNYKYDDILRRMFVEFIWKWMNHQVANLTKEIKSKLN